MRRFPFFRTCHAYKVQSPNELDKILAGPHAVICVQVVEFLKTMTPASANALLALMRSQSWENVDANTKFVLLHEINSAITRIRESMNPEDPIADPLPGERDNVFRIIKRMFESFPPRRGSEPRLIGKQRSVES